MSIEKMADEFILLCSDKESADLLNKAKKDNKGQGINVHFHDQHFGWDPKAKKHVQFSIADFKDNSKVGKLEDVVAKLKNVKLEDYK